MSQTIYERTSCKAELFIPETQPRALILLPSLTDEWSDAALVCMEREAALCVISRFNWNDDLSPWPSEKVFRNGADFKGNAKAFLAKLVTEVLPRAENTLDTKPPVGIAGYSLAGLFALWAAGEEPRFRLTASMSGSLWYPSAAEYLCGSLLKAQPDRVYLSLGTKEERSRNPQMDGNGRITQTLAEQLNTHGIQTVYESNPGTHFDNIPERIARGIEYLLS